MGLFTAHYTSYPDRCVHSNTEVFLYSAVSSPWDCSQRITLHTLTDVLIQYRSVLVYCGIQSVGLFTAHYTSYPDRCVHSNTEVFLHSAVSSPWDCSQRITLHTLTDVFIPIPKCSCIVRYPVRGTVHSALHFIP